MLKIAHCVCKRCQKCLVFGWVDGREKKQREIYTSISLRASVLATAMVGEVVLCDCDLWYTDDRCSRWMVCGGAGDGVCRSHSSPSLDKYFPPRRAAGFCNNKSSLQDNNTIALLSHRCIQLPNFIANITETDLLQRQRRASLSTHSRVSISSISFYTYTPLFSFE